MSEGRRFRALVAMAKPYRYSKPLVYSLVYSLFCAVFWFGEALAQNENYGTQNASVRTLLDQGREQFIDGNPEAAALTIERALRIEPENPVLWHQIARIRYQMKSWDEADNLSQRSVVLAGGNYQVLPERNLNLQAAIERARQGDVWTLAEIDLLLVSKATTSDSTATETEVFSVQDGGATVDGESVVTRVVSIDVPTEQSQTLQDQQHDLQTLINPDINQDINRGQQRQVRIEPVASRGVIVKPISEPVMHRTATSRLNSNTARLAVAEKRGSEVVERSIGLGGQGQARAIPQHAMPAPGYCRVWFDNRLPERQPPIVLCDSIGSSIPQGARLIVGRYR